MLIRWKLFIILRDQSVNGEFVSRGWLMYRLWLEQDFGFCHDDSRSISQERSRDVRKAREVFDFMGQSGAVIGVLETLRF